jgi:hypothetical protein
VAAKSGWRKYRLVTRRGRSRYGFLVVKRTVSGSGAVTSSMMSASGAPWLSLLAGSRTRLTFHTTTPASRGLPSENSTPGRSPNSHTRSEVWAHEVARSPTSFSSGSRRVSDEYTDW